MAGESNGREPERQSDLAVMEANEYKQKRRLERILDSIDKVEDKADQAWELFVSGDINHDAKNIMIQRAVKQTVRECYNLLLDYHKEATREAENPRAVKDNTPDADEYFAPRQENRLGAVEMDWEDDIPIYGLFGFLQSKELYEETWTERAKPRNKPARVERHTAKHTVPESVSWTAFMTLKEFLNSEHDLEIKFEELDDALPTWGFVEVPDEEGTEALANGDD